MDMLSKWPHLIVHVGSERIYWEAEVFLVACRQSGLTVVFEALKIPKTAPSTALGDRTICSPAVEMLVMLAVHLNESVLCFWVLQQQLCWHWMLDLPSCTGGSAYVFFPKVGTRSFSTRLAFSGQLGGWGYLVRTAGWDAVADKTMRLFMFFNELFYDTL